MWPIEQYKKLRERRSRKNEIKDNREKLANERLKNRIAHETFEAQRLSYLEEQIDYLENRKAVLDDDTGWIVLRADGKMRYDSDLDERDHKKIQEMAYELYQTNPHARAIIRSLEKFIIGRGANVDHRDERPKVRTIWDRFERANDWVFRQKEVVRRALRDGEMLVYKKKGKGPDGKPTILLRFIEPFEIRPKEAGDKPTFGVYTSKTDVEDVKGYNRRTVGAGGKVRDKRIPADKVIHIKLNCDSNSKRGIPILQPVMAYIKKYEQWLNDRIVLNKVRTAIALVKKYDAPPETVKLRRDEEESNRYTGVGENQRQKMYETGTVVHTTKGVDYEFISPEVDARDVATDGRAILLACSAGSGLPEFEVTGDSSNANYSSTLIAESPGVREVEDYQKTFGYFFEKIYSDVMKHAIENGELQPVQDEEEGITLTTRAEFDFPTLIYRDFWRESQAFEIMHQNKVLSRKTWSKLTDLDYDNEQNNFDEEGDPIVQPTSRPDRTNPNKGQDEPPYPD